MCLPDDLWFCIFDFACLEYEDNAQYPTLGQSAHQIRKVCRRFNVLITDRLQGVMRYANPVLKTPEDLRRFLSPNIFGITPLNVCASGLTLEMGSLDYLLPAAKAFAGELDERCRLDAAQYFNALTSYRGQASKNITMNLANRCERDLEALKPLSPLPITSLSIANCLGLRDISAAKVFRDLSALYISDAPSIRNLDFLKDMPKLETLHVIDCKGSFLYPKLNVRSLSLRFSGHPYLNGYQNLTDLCLGEYGSAQVLNCPKLTTIKAEECASLVIDNCPSLTALSAWDVGHLRVANCPDVKTFTLYSKGDFELTNPQAVETLYWADEHYLGIERFSRLKDLTLSGLTLLSDLTFLSELPELDRLCILQFDALKNLAGVERCANLRRLSVGHCESLQSL